MTTCLVIIHATEGIAIDVEPEVTKYYRTNFADLCEIGSEKLEISAIAPLDFEDAKTPDGPKDTVEVDSKESHLLSNSVTIPKDP